ncbi:MAG: shikimate dehydrogenase [Actinobacteria bacterium]|nr:shikimate dehydrogenase [Actinomycetota bacterium]|tara:strand:- start:324 stop:1202 length:879 start_codon:yes stop_codon:yes gene_type:complete
MNQHSTLQGLLGVIGDPIAHSLSPIMHTQVLQAQSVNATYLPFHVKSEMLGAALDGLRALGFWGCNVTVPHKETVIPFLDELDPLAKRLGSVNTIVNRDGQLTGYSTDGQGFMLALSEELGFQVSGKSVVILGAGGSARAILGALLDDSVGPVYLLNRRLERAQALCELASEQSPVSAIALSDEDACLQALSKADLLIQTTSVGMAPDVDGCVLSDFSWLSNDQVIVDIIYSPLETRLLSKGRLNGAKTLNGVGMLAGQGALAYTLMTGKPCAYSEMKEALLQAISVTKGSI